MIRNHEIGLKPVRTFPYYKLQYWEKRVAAWMDVQIKFESPDALLAHAKSKLKSDDRIRIMIVEERGRRRVFQDCGEVGSFDPGETKNIFSENPEIVSQMREVYDEWWNNVQQFLVNEKVPLASERPFWVEYAKQQESTGIKNWVVPNLD